MQVHELGWPPSPIEVNVNLAKEKRVAKPGTSTHSKFHAFPSMNMVKTLRVVPSLWHGKNVIISIVGH
jgi:hypothetical protein